MHCIWKPLWTTDLTLMTTSHCIFFNDAYQSTITGDLASPLAKSGNNVLKKSPTHWVHRSTGCPHASSNCIPCSREAVCNVVCGAVCWAVPSSRTSFWPQYESGKKFCGFTAVLVTSTPAWKLLCLHWKRCCHIFHQFVGSGLIHDSRGHRNLVINDFVGYSFSSKSVIDRNSFYIPLTVISMFL